MLEIAIMDADASLVLPVIIAIVEKQRDADSAAVVIPENSENFFDLRVPDMICMSSLTHLIFK